MLRFDHSASQCGVARGAHLGINKDDVGAPAQVQLPGKMVVADQQVGQ